MPVLGARPAYRSAAGSVGCLQMDVGARSPHATVASSLRMDGLFFREVEHVEQIPDRRHIHWSVGITVVHLGIGKVVAAPTTERAQIPVALDELHKRGMFCVGVRDVAAG